MLRLSRARVISDIELIINSPGPALGQRKWSARGAECSVDRHTYWGELYRFHADILHVRMPGKPAWQLIVVSEFWHRGEAEALHSVKWLKLLSGKPTDVLQWIRSNYDTKA